MNDYGTSRSDSHTDKFGLSCRFRYQQALRNKWVNIYDFLAAVEERDAAASMIADEGMRLEALTRPVEVTFFKSEGALARYTFATQKIFPRSKIDKESPLKLLLANIL